jgi:hypothetical protein
MITPAIVRSFHLRFFMAGTAGDRGAAGARPPS